MDEADLDFRPDLDWIANETSLSSDLSARLRSIRDNRLPDKQFYVSKVANIGNPSFDHELGYASAKLPDAGFQLLALFRFWNIFEYWSPYRDLVGGDWNSVLNEFIPRVALAKSTETYQMEMMALIARAHDGHANLWSSLQVRPPQGKCQLPVDILFVENQPVISGVSAANPSNLEEPEVKVGDAVTRSRWRPGRKADGELDSVLCGF